jgi:HSP20 family protein
MSVNEAKAMEKREAQAPAEAERMSERRVFMPRADIFQSGEDVVILCDVPGCDEKSVDITIEKNVMTIYGTVQPAEPEGHRLAYAEYELGDFQRSFTLSDEIDRDSISAVVSNGVLKLTLPQAAQAKARKIAVKAQ